MSKKQTKERIIVELNKEALHVMDDLQKQTGSSTRAELFRNMLRYVAATRDELDEGSVPLWMDKNGHIFKSAIHKMLFMK
ncbi:MAG: hypothetical protein LC776_00745 [Acidobacteria bacterium]|nr:hypothetical protein [Acidobacteriota bacterium]